MPRQQGDPRFDDDEQLYRRLHEKWIGDGDRVRDAAIDLQGTSVDRSLLAGTPTDCMARSGTDVAAVGEIAFGQIPDRFDGPPAMPYESVVVYKPENGNDSHSEIQFWRVGDVEPSKPQSKVLKAQIREQIAARMRVACRR